MGSTPFEVLLIEDNPADAELLREYLAETGFQVSVRTLGDGEAAIRFFERLGRGLEKRPQVVFLDLNLPKRNGHEVLEIIRSQDRDLKVIVYSGSRSPEDTSRAMRNRANAYLVKPMGRAEVGATIEELRSLLASMGAAPAAAAEA